MKVLKMVVMWEYELDLMRGITLEILLVETKEIMKELPLVVLMA
jgi:hypothetical protein